MKSIRQRRSASSVLKWAVLVSLVFAQLAFAVHQKAHRTADTGEYCAICLKFDRDDTVPVGDLAHTVASAAYTPGPVAVPAPATRPGFAPYSARASP